MTFKEFLKEAWGIIRGPKEELVKLSQDEILETKRLLERLREGEGNI